MTLHRLQLFVSIAGKLSTTKVSEELHISQPSVSQQLKLLQEEYGGPLYNRTGRGLVLTERGQAFRQDAEALLAQVEGLRRKYAPAQTGQTNETLALGGTLGPSISALPSLMTQFEKSHPKIKVSLKAGTSLEIEALVLDASVELAIIADPLLSPLLEMELFRKEILSVFVAPDHPLARRKKIDPGELTALPLIIKGGRNSRNWTDEFLRGLITTGLKPNVRMRLESPDLVKAAVRNGAGAGILYRDVIDVEVQRGMFKVLEVTGVDLTCSSYIVYSKEKPLSRSAQGFLTILRAARQTVARIKGKAVTN